MSIYTPGIPNATDLISSSQQPIKDNFGQLNTQFGVEHSAFNTGSANGTGLHKQATMPAQVTPNPLPAVSTGTYFTSKTGTVGGLITEAIFKSGDASSLAILSAIKAWALFDGNTLTLLDGYNISASITRVGGMAGQYVITMTNAMQSNNYGVLIGSVGTVSAGVLATGAFGTYKVSSTTQFELYAKNSFSSATVDSVIVFVVLQS